MFLNLQGYKLINNFNLRISERKIVEITPYTPYTEHQALLLYGVYLAIVFET